MKRITIICCLLALPLLSLAQNKKADELFNKYSGLEGYTSVHLTKYMFQLFSKLSGDEQDQSLKEATSGLTAIKILTLDSVTNANRKHNFYQEMNEAFSSSAYEDLMIIKDGAEEVKFMVLEEAEIIKELVMIVGGEGEGVLIFLEGNIDLEKISKLSESMNIKEFERLDEVNKERNSDQKK